ncbi:MAG: hypothetical protein ABUL48_04900, partial [Pseudorhodoplanes sp.]
FRPRARPAPPTEQSETELRYGIQIVAEIKQAAVEHELGRFVRPDAIRFLRPDWRRYVKPQSELARLYERYERKYSPDQPRDYHGRWTESGGSSGSTQRIASRISPAREAECELMRRQDEFICKAVQLRACYAQAYLRYSNCLAGRPIPDLRF